MCKHKKPTLLKGSLHMKMTLKGMLAALLFSISLGLSSGVLAQDVAPINVNTADAELLAELPGIGPSRADAIIEERETNGVFESAADLERVSGIGPATVDRMRDQVTFE
jgi:competence protein ComEA|tara:strand:+ start:574 stop:900 length:327 start_codon:yes stop_codon:yes gene_type:complete